MDGITLDLTVCCVGAGCITPVKFTGMPNEEITSECAKCSAQITIVLPVGLTK